MRPAALCVGQFLNELFDRVRTAADHRDRDGFGWFAQVRVKFMNQAVNREHFLLRRFCVLEAFHKCAVDVHNLTPAQLSSAETLKVLSPGYSPAALRAV